MTTWSINNLDGHLPNQVWESFVNHHVAAGILLGILIISLSYPLIHQFYLKKSEHYREKLNREQQLVVLQHTVEALFLSVIFAPFTYVIFSANFEEQEFEPFRKKLTAITTFMATVIIMYLIELASRFSNLRPVVAAHHLCATMNGILTAFFLTTANVRAASLLVYFITFEAVTFYGLVMYRLVPSHKMTKPIILAGMLIFGLSRPIQFIWIIGGLWINWEDLVIWQAVVQILLTCVFTALQLYSLTIHFQLYKRCANFRVQRQKSIIKGVAVETLEELESALRMEIDEDCTTEFAV